MPKGSHLTSEHQRRAGQRRAAQDSFLQHNQAIAPDGFHAQSARAYRPIGLRLLKPQDIQFLFLSDLRASRDFGHVLTEKEQRLLYGNYVWDALWHGLNAPAKPDTDQFLRRAQETSASTRAGLPLEQPLDILFVAPDDFFATGGRPLRKDQQRARFRAALRAGRAAAEAWSAQIAQEQAQASRAQPRQVGRRVAMSRATAPAFVRSQRPADHYHYGRPDLPAFHPKNIRPARPYDIPTGEKLQRRYWMSPDLSSSGDE